jgi:hypothetical protein
VSLFVAGETYDADHPLAVLQAKYRAAVERLEHVDPHTAMKLREELQRIRDAIEAPQQVFPISYR